MGNQQSNNVRKVFAKLDKDDKGYVTLDQILYVKDLPDVEGWSSAQSPLLLFRFDESLEGSINFEEFKKLMDHLQAAQTKAKTLKKRGDRRQALIKSGSFISQKHVWTNVDKESASELDLSRDAPPPMIAGRRKSEFVTDDEQLEELELQEVIQTEAREFFSKLLKTNEGRRQFLSWLFRLADVDGDNAVSTHELSLVLTTLSHDGIMPENLSFYATNIPGSEEKKEDSKEPEPEPEPNPPRQTRSQSELAASILGEYDTAHTGYLHYDEFMLFGDLILKHYEASNEEGTIGKYLLKRKIGKGAAGEVWLAIDTETKFKKAIKVIPMGDVSDRSRIDVEVKAMLMLHHPHIVSLEEVLETEEHVFFIMELCGGGNLSELLYEDKPLPEDVSLYYFIQLVDSLIYCHQEGVVHRDLKLENLLLDNKCQLKVSDFGHAGIFSQGFDFFSTGMTGTITHLSPEQISGQCYSGEKIDTWTLGIVLYRMVVGLPPFRSSDPQEFVASIQELRYDFPDHVSAECRDLISKILKVEPEERMPLEDILHHPWCKGPQRQLVLGVQRVEVPKKFPLPICLKVLQIATHEGIHVIDETPTEIHKRIRCIWPARDLKFMISYEIEIEKHQSFVEFVYKDGEVADLIKLKHEFEKACSKYELHFEDLMPVYDVAIHKWEEHERKILRKFYDAVAKKSSTGDTIDKKVFRERFFVGGKLPGSLLHKIFLLFDFKRNGTITYEEFVISLTVMCKSSESDRTRMFFLITGRDDYDHFVVTKLKLEEALCGFVTLVHSQFGFNVNPSKLQAVVKALVNSIFEEYAKSEEGQLTLEEFQAWAHANPNIASYYSVCFLKNLDPTYVPNNPPRLPDIPVPPTLIFNGDPIKSDLLDDVQLSKLRDSIDPIYWDSKWELVYKPSIKGYSLKSLYTSVNGRHPLLIVIKDSLGHLFGVYVFNGISVNTNYYGDSESFLFTFLNGFHVFATTGANTMFNKTTPNFMAFGGPEYGLWLDSEIDNGISKESATFGNTSLAGQENFKCVHMEVWELVKTRSRSNSLGRDGVKIASGIQSPHPISPFRTLLLSSASSESLLDLERPPTDKLSRAASPPTPEIKSPRSPVSPLMERTPVSPLRVSNEGISKHSSEETFDVRELELAKQKLEDELLRVKKLLEVAKKK